uniref:Uncharacterized protein n=1 Tax=Panagrellus redivivus TaxID=6233 RepID=A0A7E4ZTA1_PANRE
MTFEKLVESVPDDDGLADVTLIEYDLLNIIEVSKGEPTVSAICSNIYLPNCDGNPIHVTSLVLVIIV